jgi:drug/metabolite transporter (DMT)-like permease
MRREAIKSLTASPFFNVMMFSLFWALQIFVSKLGFAAGADVLPFQVLMVTVALATLVALIAGRSWPQLMGLYRERRDIFWKLFAANVLQAGLGTSLSIIGIAQTEAINAGFLVKLATVSTIVFAWLMLKEPISASKVMVVVVMLSGAFLLTTKGQRLLPRAGDLFILGACVCWSLGNVMVRKVLKTERVEADAVTMQKPMASLPVFLALAGISVYSAWMPGGLKEVLRCCSFAPAYWPYVAGAGVCLGLTWIYLYRTLHVATASYMTLMSMATPVFVSVLAMAFLGERLAWIQAIGGGMILLSGVGIYFSDMATA